MTENYCRECGKWQEVDEEKICAGCYEIWRTNYERKENRNGY